MGIISRLKELYSQKKYRNTFARCDDCVNWRSYYFDEYDADAWCDLENNTEVECCYDFKKKRE